ncbi:MAG: collagenase [Bacteroidia bacterium]|nr:collagenase [Bacteroidia bacterium]
MLKSLKKLLISLGSLLSVSVLFWIIILMNPGLSYAHQTEVGNVTVFHDQQLPEGSEALIQNAYKLLKNAELFQEAIQLQLCFNDGSNFPNRFPLKGGIAYSYWNKAIIYRSRPEFQQNRAFFSWDENAGESRSWDLTELLAHEFVHVLQSYHNRLGPIQYPAWKIEGYAEYIARSKRSELLNIRENINILKQSRDKPAKGLPWIRFEDKTGVPQSYFQYRLLIQFLMEGEGMTYKEILNTTESREEIEKRMLNL